MSAGAVLEGPGIDTVGSAFGFLQVAHADELIDAVEEAGAGCVECHAAQQVLSPPLEWTHEGGYAVVAAALAFGTRPEPGPPARPGTAGEVLQQCAGCHADAVQQPTGTPGSP
ncbi:MAG: hypothetical protein ACI8PZ_002886 [Myxococcota bacterium]|jgi:hypothetical protein